MSWEQLLCCLGHFSIVEMFVLFQIDKIQYFFNIDYILWQKCCLFDKKNNRDITYEGIELLLVFDMH